uniref:Uncharacterized protein n=1 Tax=Anguilla anguilla TaxID=7936 RepID=A0A0E9V718_ANGAN
MQRINSSVKPVTLIFLSLCDFLYLTIDCTSCTGITFLTHC